MPLQSAAYASASTRSLCAPQRTHNGSNASRVPVQSTGLEIRRARAPPATPACSHTFSHALRSTPSALLHTTCDVAPSPSRLARSVRAAVAVEVLLPPVASRAKNVWPARSCPPAAAALPESKKWGCTEVARLLASQQTSLLGNSCSFDCGCRDTPLTAAVGTHRLSQACGRQVIRLTTGSEACGCGLTPRGKDATCAVTRYHLLRDSTLPDATGSRHTTQPAHAGGSGHHTTVSPLFFIAYPQTRVPAPSMLGPYADAAGVGQPMVSNCSPTGLLSPRTHTQNLQIPNF